MIRRLHERVKRSQKLHFVRRFEQKIILEWLTPLSSQHTVLDVACGSGWLASRISQTGATYYGIDLDSSAVERARKSHPQCHFTVGNAEELQYPDSYFDKIVSNCALEHFDYDEKALMEMRRVLKPGGILVLTVDSLSYKNLDVSLKERHKQLFSVVNYYSLGDLADKLHRAGFELRDNRYYINSPVSSFFYNVNIRYGFTNWTLYLFPVAYPLSLLSDKLLGRKDEGYGLAVKCQSHCRGKKG